MARRRTGIPDSVNRLNCAQLISPEGENRISFAPFGSPPSMNDRKEVNPHSPVASTILHFLLINEASRSLSSDLPLDSQLFAFQTETWLGLLTRVCQSHGFPFPASARRARRNDASRVPVEGRREFSGTVFRISLEDGASHDLVKDLCASGIRLGRARDSPPTHTRRSGTKKDPWTFPCASTNNGKERTSRFSPTCRDY